MGQGDIIERRLQSQEDARSRKKAKTEGFVGIGTFEKRATGQYAVSDKELAKEKAFRRTVERDARLKKVMNTVGGSTIYTAEDEKRRKSFSKAVTSQNVQGVISSVESRGMHDMVRHDPFSPPPKELERDKNGFLRVKNSVWG